jgi:hypothetical protein
MPRHAHPGKPLVMAAASSSEAVQGTPPPQINLAEHRIRRKRVLGGLTSEYQAIA